MSPRLQSVILTVLLFSGATAEQSRSRESDAELRERAYALAQEIIIIDTHVDVPYRLSDKMEDISVRTPGGDFDYVRAKAGGLNAPFMSIYVPSSYEQNGAKDFADSLIVMVNGFATRWPGKFSMAYSVADIRDQFRRGVVSLPMGMENGAPLEGKLENVRYFYDRGIRYITLTHSKNNHICDSSYDTERTWDGLSPFGKQVIEEMNRVGIMVDVSHVSDSAFYQVMRISKAAVIASHSSCRYFTPGWERNMDDEMIKLLASNGGVIQINFGSSFLSNDYRTATTRARDALKQFIADNNLKDDDQKAKEFGERYRRENPRKHADVMDAVAHIDHVVKLVGVDHVGFGSDFDGVGDSLPTGLKDVSCYPNLIFALLKNGYSEDDIKKICSENTLRVWSAVEQTARDLQKK